MSITDIGNDTVVVGTVYPGVGQFLKDYFSSLERQSCKNFDLLIANDGFNELDKFLVTLRVPWHRVEVGGSISSNRRVLIRKAVEMGYRKIIFTDFDDKLREDRVEVTSDMLDRDSIIVNDINIVDIDGNEEEACYFSRRFSENEVITLDSLRTGNVMGFTNSAVRAEVIQKSLESASSDTEAFDWYLWSSVLLEGYTARFTLKTSTNYRVYSGNITGLPQQLHEKSLLKGVSIKCRHYELMSQLDKEYIGLADEFQWLNKKIKDRNCNMQYLDLLQEYQIKYHMWWENIRTPSEVGFK